MHNKFAYVKGLRTSTFDKQLKATAKAIYAGDQANKQVTRTEKFMNNWVTPFVNVIVTGKCFTKDLIFHLPHIRTEFMNELDVELSKEKIIF